MNPDDLAPMRRRPRLRFSVLTLFIFMTLVCVLLFWLTRPRPVDAVALLTVRSQSNYLTSTGSGALDFEIIERTQLAYLKSVAVLQAALNDSQVAKLPLVKDQADPVAWLQRELQAEFLQNSEILSVRLAVPSNRGPQARIVLAAVVNAYLQAATAAEQKRLQLQLQSQQAEYDALHVEIQDLSARIATLRSQRGADDPEAKLLQMEADRKVGQAGKLKADLDLGNSLGSGPPRVRLIQPATVAK
jgi:hypothetical protein